jgi:hypothetical protein
MQRKIDTTGYIVAGCAVVGLLIGGISYYGSVCAHENSQDDQLKDHETRIKSVEYANHSIDTIKILLRSKQR